MEELRSFEFKQCITIPRSTGRRASGLRELRDGIAGISDESLYLHTYQYFLKGHILEYTNDFAHWAAEGLEERVLSEHLSNVDPFDFKGISGLRLELLSVIDRYLKEFPAPRDVMPGDEFFFSETVTITFPIGVRARNLAEFLIAVRYVDSASIYYHFYESRVRLGMDDFSMWFDAIGNKELAEAIKAIDPFMHSIEGIREHIAEAVEHEVRTAMEGISTK